MKKVTSYNLKKTNSKAISEKSLLAGYASTSLYVDKVMDIYLSDNGFLVELSDESSSLLKGLIDKHERTASYLIEKMIRKFCSAEVEHVAVVSAMPVPAPVKKASGRKLFKSPTPLEVDAYMVERGLNNPNEAVNFCDFYESKGWVVGKAKMKCWKAAVRNWLKGAATNKQSSQQGKTSGNKSACEDFING